MLKKIISIKNVGKFENHEGSHQGFKKFTGIFSDNGMGKTTIATILHSLADNNPDLILGRKRLGTPGKPKIKLDTDTGFVEFNETTWNRHIPDIEVFDTRFVNLNVFSGLSVDLSQRRRMYQFIIGDEAIKLNQDVVDLNTEISEYTSKIREQKGVLNKYLGQIFKLDDFLKLEKVEKVAEKIGAKTKELNALTNTDKINKLPSLNKIEIPEFDVSSLKGIFSKSIVEISADAEQKTKDHISNHLDLQGEAWIKKGVEYLKGKEQCPLCNSGINGNDLIKSFNEYFNEQYISFKEEISTGSASFTDSFSDSLSVTMKNTVQSNDRTINDWKSYLEIVLSKMDIDGKTLVPILSAQDSAEKLLPFISVTSSSFLEKEQSPLEEPKSLSVFESSLGVYQEYLKSVQEYNAVVEAQNILISQYKKGLSAGDINTERNSLNNLKGSLVRYKVEVAKECDIYAGHVKNKKDLETKKSSAQQKLEDATNKIPEQYQDKINYYLERFGAEFYLAGHKKINPGGKPATEYKIHINGSEIPLGDSSTPDDVTSFKNTLSEGDKSTLAFSYFLAKLHSDERISDKIIVFDDPISSQDNSRRERTKSFLSHFGRKAKQLILMSHDSKFLQEMYLNNKQDFGCFMIDKTEEGSKLKETSFADLNKCDHIWNLDKVINYSVRSEGEPKDVIRCIRPLCEHYCRMECPNSFTAKETLGGMIPIIEKALDGDEVYVLNAKLIDLKALNDFTRPHHHGGETPPAVNTTELNTNCGLLLSEFYPQLDQTNESNAE